MILNTQLVMPDNAEKPAVLPNIQGSEVDTTKVTMGAGMSNIAEAPSEEAPPQTGEETPVQSNNDEEVTQPPQAAESVKEEAVPDEGGETEPPKSLKSGSKKARELGESRKHLAEALIASAKDSDVAREHLKTKLEESPSLDAYIKKRYPKEYASITEGLSNDEWEARSQDDKARSEIDLRVKIMTEMEDAAKKSQALDLAETMNVSEEEAESLYEMAQSLEGKVIGGKELTFEDALTRAAHIVKPSNAKAAGVQVKSVPSVQTPSKKEPEMTLTNEQIEAMHQLTGRKPEEVLAGLEKIESKIVTSKDGRTKLRLG